MLVPPVLQSWANQIVSPVRNLSTEQRMSSSRVYVPQGPCWILVFLLNTLHLSYSRRPCVLTLHLWHLTFHQCTQCKKSGTAQSILCIICLSLLEVKAEGVKKGYLHTRRDQSSGLSVSHLGSCCWEKISWQQQ